MQKSSKEARRISRSKRPWRSSGSEASTDGAQPASLSLPPTSPLLLQKTERRRELGLRRLWSAVRSVSGTGGCDTDAAEDCIDGKPAPASSLPLLQVWPSQDSPRGEADGQSFVFPGASAHSPHSHHDSGIDSIQASPSPGACGPSSSPASPSSARCWQPGSLLHPDHARRPLEPPPVATPAPAPPSPSSSTTSSVTSVAHAAAASAAAGESERRRSSTLTARYSMFDALDLDFVLLRAAARGSVGPYSLSGSVHKLTFTQSLAFPALARGLAAGKSRDRQHRGHVRQRLPHSAEPGLNAFAKIITTLVLVLVSVLVFGVVYKFVRT